MAQVTLNYTKRCENLAELLRKDGLDLAVISPSSDMKYLTGYEQVSSDRPTLLLIPATGEPFMVVPQLEVPKAHHKTHGLFRIVAWQETDSPFDVSRNAVKGPAKKVIVEEQMWAGDFFRLSHSFAGAEFTSAQPYTTALRIKKSEEELTLLRAAGSLADEHYDSFRQLTFAGKTEAALNEEIIAVMKANGAPQASCILASGENTSSPHNTPGDRVIKEGDTVWMDFGGRVVYPADCTRTVHVGEPSEEYKHVYNIVRKAQETTARSVKPGMQCQEIDRIARKIITDAGYGEYFMHRTGHGLGLDVHEHPYMVEGNTRLLEPGMVFSVEPGIYIPGKFGVRIEDIVVVTETGVEVLNKSSHDIFVVQ